MQKSLHSEFLRRSWAKALELKAPELGGPLNAPFAKYLGDPCRFDREVLGNDQPETRYWSMQEQIAAAIEKKRRVLVATCNGSGKSTFIARFIPYFMTTRRNARVRLTAGSLPQLMGTHRKVRGAHLTSRRKLPGEVNKSAMWELGPEWLYDGVSPDTEENMQGLHSTGDVDEPGADGGLLAIIDEASAAEDFKFKAIRGYMTTRNTCWLVMGNPNRPTGQFKEMWDAAEHDDSWERINVSAFDVPNHILAPDFIESETRYWGVDSPQYQVRVLGQFPKTGGDYMVFPLSDLEGSADMLMRNEDGLHLGVDVARGDGDLCTMVLQENRRVVDAVGWQSHDTMEVAERVATKIDDRGINPRNVHVDVIGIGAGVVDRLREAGYPVEGVNFGSKKMVGDWKKVIGKRVLVLNRRAELYWAARCLLRTGEASVPREYRQDIWHEASRIQYLPKDILQIEPKALIKKRLDGRSPDFCDAWVLGFSRGGRRRVAYFG